MLILTIICKRVKNTAVIFTAFCPTGLPALGEHLKLETREFDVNELSDGEIIVKVHYLSTDPYQRGRFRQGTAKQVYPAPYEIGQPINSDGTGSVITSKNPKFKVGQLVQFIGMRWEEYNRIKVSEMERVFALDESIPLPSYDYLGVIGMPSKTAFVGLYDIGKPKKGETIFINAASGAVGQIVGQLAKLEGLKVYGSAGSDDKVAYLREIGYDGAFNYKTKSPLEGMKELCTDGIDIFFDNVGGEFFEAALELANQNARIIACGMIAGYNDGFPQGIRNMFHIIGKRITVRGFIVYDLYPKYAEEFKKVVVDAVVKGKIKYRTDVSEVGIEHAVPTFRNMMNGKNFGKAIIKVSEGR